MKIYAYWDKPANIPAYLQLCVATWQAHGGFGKVCLITQDNLHKWLPDGVLDLHALRQYPVPQQKDAIEVAMLAHYGGIFMDIDTISSAPFVAIREALADCEIALYGFHLSTVGARQHSPVAQRWLELLQETLSLPREALMAATGLNYTELGNYTFELLRNELATGKRAQPGEPVTKVIGILRKLQRIRLLKSRRQTYIAQIDPRRSGYIAERAYRRADKLTARERYISFWFDERLPVDTVSSHGGGLIALHHSWTPPEYSAKGFSELADDQSLLSRYLRTLLGPDELAHPGILETVLTGGGPAGE